MAWIFICRFLLLTLLFVTLILTLLFSLFLDKSETTTTKKGELLFIYVFSLCLFIYCHCGKNKRMVQTDRQKGVRKWETVLERTRFYHLFIKFTLISAKEINIYIEVYIVPKTAVTTHNNLFTYEFCSFIFSSYLIKIFQQ